MDYHIENIIKDVVLLIHADGYVFSKIEEIWPNFKDEPNNLRISLAVDGVTPFG